ncbi:MAG TPA: hypothetical protein VKD04_00180 [Burkholderiales bacterium]|nr:hypothetical protein [Burkholderiales bacterium]
MQPKAERSKGKVERAEKAEGENSLGVFYLSPFGFYLSSAFTIRNMERHA